jgi:hypothetical protein
MQYISFLLFSMFMLIACSTAKIAVDDNDWGKTEQYDVKGRQGLMIRQKLSFGEYQTVSINRSWTRGSSYGLAMPISSDWVDRLNIEWVKRKQTVRFNLVDAQGNRSEVTAFSKVQYRDLTIGHNPNSIVNIAGDILKIGDNGSDTYAVRIVPSANDYPWEMIIDNNAAQRNPRKYVGLLARSKNEYYTIQPIYKLTGKNGKSVNIPMSGSVGFEIKNRAGDTYAAVSLIDNGVVYFTEIPEEEKFLLANAMAALLLQQDLETN